MGARARGSGGAGHGMADCALIQRLGRQISAVGPRDRLRGRLKAHLGEVIRIGERSEHAPPLALGEVDLAAVAVINAEPYSVRAGHLHLDDTRETSHRACCKANVHSSGCSSRPPPPFASSSPRCAAAHRGTSRRCADGRRPGAPCGWRRPPSRRGPRSRRENKVAPGGGLRRSTSGRRFVELAGPRHRPPSLWTARRFPDAVPVAAPLDASAGTSFGQRLRVRQWKPSANSTARALDPLLATNRGLRRFWNRPCIRHGASLRRRRVRIAL